MEHATTSSMTIGRDLGIFGRWIRLAGGIVPLTLTLMSVLQNPQPLNEELAFWGVVGLYFLGVGAVYFLVFAILREQLSKLNPWVSTVLFYGPVFLMSFFHLGPQQLQIALSFYISISLILNFFMKYGGCEVVALPTLIHRKRYVVFCPLNAIDVVEKELSENTRNRVAKLIAIGITLVVGGYFLIVEYYGMTRVVGLSLDIDNRWALLLLIPLIFFVMNLWDIFQQQQRKITTEVLAHSVGVLALAAFTYMFVMGARLPLFGGFLVVVGVAISGMELFKRIQNKNHYEGN